MIMVVITATLGWLVSFWLGGMGGAIVAILAFVGWGVLNRHSGYDGLFRANLKSYFSARRSGQSVDDALKSMIEARYAIPRLDLPERHATKRRLLEFLAEDRGRDTPERVRVVSTVLMVWRHEHDMWSSEPHRDFEMYSKVSQMYEEIARSYGLLAD
jgi:hypothetical protein